MHSTSQKTQAFRPFLLILCFLISFLVSVNGIRWLTPEPYIRFFSERLTVFESQKDEYNLVFIGSSHLRSGIDPLLFDRLTAEAGYPCKSFNFSMRGIQLPEMLHLLRRIRTLRPADLKWVVLEPRTWTYIRTVNIKHRRLVYFHDVPSTLMALRGAYHQAKSRADRFPACRIHLQQFGYRLTNQGLARSLITNLYHGNSPARAELLQQVVTHQGYNPRKGCTFNLANSRFYEENVQTFASNYRKSPLKPELAELLARLLCEIEAMGAKPIFLFPPIMGSPYELELPADSPAVDIVRLDDVERYPELFALENRWDMEHMNTIGAELTTTAAAEAFLGIANGKDER